MKVLSTGNWEVLKGERIRRWPSSFGGKRNINVEMHSWVDVSPGASHIEVSVYEEKNQWWCEDQNCWVSIYSDSTASGYSLRASVYTDEEAESLARSFIKIILENNKDTKYTISGL